MHTNRNLISLVIIFTFSCGGQVLESNPGTGGSLYTGVTIVPNIGSGGTHSTVGGASFVLSTSLGGRLGAGGVSPMGGLASTGGSSAGPRPTGGASPTGCTIPTITTANNCAIPSSATGSFTIANSNYFKAGNLAGYGFVYISPYGGPSLTCPNSSFGASATALCGAGIVPADCTYNTVGGFGLMLNQPTSGGDPSPAITSPAVVSQVVVTFVNTAGTDLHIEIVQLLDNTQTYYCYEAEGASSPLVLQASDFNTTCWTTGGTPWDGTGAEQFQFVIPSQAMSPTRFDACIENVVFS